MTSKITRKFYWPRPGERWIAYCVNGRVVALTREELDGREIAA